MNRKLEQAVRDVIVFLLAERSDYGLGLLDRLEKRGLFIGDRIYPLLRDMERKGVLASEERYENLAERDGHPRIYYRLASVRNQPAPRSGT